MRRRWIYGLSLLVLISITAGLIVGEQLFFQAEANQEREAVYRQLLLFQSQLENRLHANTSLFKGLIAYLEQSEMDIPDNTGRIMHFIFKGSPSIVRNVAILKDTTIIYNYPTEANQSSIGINLSGIEDQRDMVLQVKQTLANVFIGPIELVQGGMGFISRQAIVKNGEYWGQLGIVLNGDQFLDELVQIAGDLNLRFAFHLASSPENGMIVGQKEILDLEPISTDILLYDNRWTLSVIPMQGWNDNSPLRLLGFIFALLIASIPSILILLLLQTRAKLQVMAMHDSLTGLLNRNFFERHHKTILAQAKRQEELLGIALIDLNDFKDINDSLGHITGDMVLKAAAEALKNSARESDMIYRFGGDEFLVVLTQLKSKADLDRAKNRLFDELSFSLTVRENKIQIQPSVGTALFPTDGESIDELLNLADNRMYEQKRGLKLSAKPPTK